MRTIVGIFIVILATIFELIGRIFHVFGDIAMSTAIMLLKTISHTNLSE